MNSLDWISATIVNGQARATCQISCIIDLVGLVARQNNEVETGRNVACFIVELINDWLRHAKVIADIHIQSIFPCQEIQ